MHHSEGVDLMPANIELSDLEATLVNAMSREITLRTYVNEAKKNIKGIITRKVGVKWMWSIPGEDCNIAEVSYEKE